MSDVPDYPEIVPKSSSEARGIDFCGTADYHYIIRSDLGVYMKCTNFNAGSGVKIYALSEACKWGDHYLAITFGRSLLAFQDDDVTYFYIIKGNEYRRVTNMAEDNAPVVYSLHPNCRGGSSYYSAFGNYYIIFADRGVYRRVTNMNTDEGAVEYRIHEAFQDGIYFWGVTDSVYCLKRAGKWGLSYHRSTNMNKDYNPANFSVHTSVINFLPGGLAQTKGKAFGYWEKLASFKNVSGVAVDWERTIKESVGFKKSEMPSANISLALKPSMVERALTHISKIGMKPPSNPKPLKCRSHPTLRFTFGSIKWGLARRRVFSALTCKSLTNQRHLKNHQSGLNRYHQTSLHVIVIIRIENIIRTRNGPLNKCRLINTID